MRRHLSALVLVLLSVGAAAPASADEIGPDDHLCTLETQQSDGSTCESCSVSMQDREAGDDPCGELSSRPGWSRRCSIGATHSTTIYCDRVADFTEVGGSGCGCRVGDTRSADARGLGLALLAALLLRRRRA